MCADHRLAGVLDLLEPDGEATVRPFPPTPTPWASAYSVTAGTTRRVVRLIELQVAEKGVTATEFRAAQLLGDHGIGPRVHHADPATGVLVMDEIDGAPAVRPVRLWQALSLARVLRRLHSLEMDGEPRLHVEKELAASAAVAELVGRIPELGVYGEASARFDALRGALARLRIADRLCHNDLNLGNILFDGTRAWLIDFDHLGLADPLYDVANAVLSLGMDDLVRERFLEAYFDRPAKPCETARLELMSCLVLLRYGLSALSLVPDGVHDQLGTWTPDMAVGNPFDFSRRENEDPGWLVFRLSLTFIHAGLARLDAASASRAAESLGLLGTRV